VQVPSDWTGRETFDNIIRGPQNPWRWMDIASDISRSVFAYGVTVAVMRIVVRRVVIPRCHVAIVDTVCHDIVHVAKIASKVESTC
jgi:hypothetical protein